MIADAYAIVGKEEDAVQMRQSRMQMDAIEEKYGRLPNRLVGYSLGGAKSLYLGNRYNIPTTTFNPLVGARSLATSSSTPTR